ncbi:MAG: LacI family DNA-binding transcriptional regulator [Bacteroidota bacterium]
MKSTQVTIKDLARELNISPSTVSRALKDHPDISPDTKKAVNELAKKLNYHPNAVALSLRKSKTNTIGVIIPEIVHFFFSTVISGIEEVAYASGYNVMVCQSNEIYDREVTDTYALLASRVDGMLVSISRETTNMEHLKEIQDRGVPLVFFDRVFEGIDASQVVVDDEKGAYDATCHLIEMGYQDIAHVSGPPGLLISKMRMNGYKKALQEHNIDVREDLIFEASMGSKEEAYEKIKSKLVNGLKLDAVFAHSDMCAYGALLAVQESGMKVPEDCGIVGFSDWQFSAFLNPSLTTVMQPGYEMGRAAAELFIKESKTEEDVSPEKIVLSTELIIRDSSKRK